jgi:hypothetical protein
MHTRAQSEHRHMQTCAAACPGHLWAYGRTPARPEAAGGRMAAVLCLVGALLARISVPANSRTPVHLTEGNIETRQFLSSKKRPSHTQMRMGEASKHGARWPSRASDSGPVSMARADRRAAVSMLSHPQHAQDNVARSSPCSRIHRQRA